MQELNYLVIVHYNLKYNEIKFKIDTNEDNIKSNLKK